MLRTVRRGWRTRSSPVNRIGEGDARTSGSCSIDHALRVHFAPTVRAAGFKGSGRNFWRTTDIFVLVVNVQGSMAGGRFAINLGIHPLPLIKDDPRKLKEYECEFRRRLSADGEDKWWDYCGDSASMVAAAVNAADMFVKHGRPSLERQVAPGAPLLVMSPDEFASYRERLSGFEASPARAARALAFIREWQDRQTDAIAFAMIALAESGRAVGIAQEMDTFIERLSRGGSQLSPRQ